MGETSSDSTRIRGLYTFCLAKPGSTTYTTPSIVSEVSAILVETTHLRLPGVSSKTSRCFCGGKLEYSGRQASGCSLSFCSRCVSTSAVSCMQTAQYLSRASGRRAYDSLGTAHPSTQGHQPQKTHLCAGLLDLLLARQEEQDVALALTKVDLQAGAHLHRYAARCLNS
jgi:hypothetical protein